MADDELAAIRAKRMAELQARSGGHGGGPTPEQQNEMANKEKEMKNTLLSQCLDQAARARLSSIALVKPDKAAMIENAIINMARTGQLAGKLSEEGLVGFIERVNEQVSKKTTVKFERRRIDDDDDDL